MRPKNKNLKNEKAVIKSAIQAIRLLRKGVLLGPKLSIKKMKENGRK